MKFSEYLFDRNNRDTLTRDHLIVAKTIKRCHRRHRASSTEVWALIAAVAIVGFYAAGQRWTRSDVDQRFLSREGQGEFRGNQCAYGLGSPKLGE